jgi:hypothetical protein
MGNLHDWINSVFLLVISIFIFMQNSIVSKMKAFTDIFDLDKVKKYVKIREETIMTNAVNLITDDAKTKKIMDESIYASIDKLKEVYLKQMGEEHSELVNFAITVLLKHKKEERDELINYHLPNTSRYLIEICDNAENNIALQNNKIQE